MTSELGNIKLFSNAHLLQISTQSLIDKLFFCMKCSPYGVLSSTLFMSRVIEIKKAKPNVIRKMPRLIET